MKKLTTLVILVLAALSPMAAFSQAQLLAVTPNSAYPGETQTVVIQGLGTHFSQGNSIVSFGPGIDILKTEVQAEVVLSATIKIGANTAPGTRTVTVTTGNERATMQSGFEIFERGGKLMANIQIIPVQSIRLADFDPNDVNNAPLLFTVFFYNDNQPRKKVKAVFTLTGLQYGQIATATKYFMDLSPMDVRTFDNRQFDNYSISGISNDLVQKALKTGTVPADVYSYKVEFFDTETNQKLADAEGTNTILNIVNRPELIRPGNAASMAPPVINELQPMFQWFSQLDRFDFYLYPVFPGQTTPEEIALNRPVYKQENVFGKELVLPALAEPLQEGQVYAWQVVALTDGSQGTNRLPSEVFWFKYSSQAIVNTQINTIQLTPDNVYVPVTERYLFTAKGLNADGEEIEIEPKFRIVPSTGGTIDEHGNFTAGSTPGSVAVVAEYGNLQSYVTVFVTSWKAEPKIMDTFLEEVFGLTK